MIQWEEEARAVLVTLPKGPSLLTPSFMEEIASALNQVENETQASVLILTSSDEKIFCSGLDLEWMTKSLAAEGTSALEEMFQALVKLYSRFLTYPLLIICAINGHAFAAGALLAWACDFRVMNRDHGFICLPEIDLGVPFLPSALALCRKVMPVYLFDDLVFSGRRLSGAEAEQYKLVACACPRVELTDRARDLAARLQKGRTSIKAMKIIANRKILDLIERDDESKIVETAMMAANFLSKRGQQRIQE